jgi:hypothetical protein
MAVGRWSVKILWTEARVRERAGKHKLIPGVPVVWLQQLSAMSAVVEKSVTRLRSKYRGSGGLEHSGWRMLHDVGLVADECLAVDDLHPLGALYIAALDGDDAALLNAAQRLRGAT